MFKLRKEHIEAFREIAVAAPRERIVRALRVALPEESAGCSEEELIRLCDKGIDRADKYDLGEEHNIYGFVAAMLIYGENFDTDPNESWSQELLINEEMDEEQKGRQMQLRIFFDTGKRI